MAKRPARPSSRDSKTPPLEWAVAAAGLAFIAAAVGLIVSAEIADGGEPPAIDVRAERVEPVEGGWLVRFAARNPSAEAVSEVQVTGTLQASGERRSVVLDYLPGGGVRRGGFLFDGDPRSGGLTLAAEGYREP